MPIFEKTHVDHERHLCRKIENGVALEDYKKLVTGAKWVCRQCGRAAASAQSLCDPVSL